MDSLTTSLAQVVAEIGQRKQKRRFNLLLAIFFAILAMTAIIAAPIVQSFVNKKAVAVAEWTDGLTPQAFGTETWSGTGTETDAFKIATATDLAQLACNVNAGTTYEGMYFTLTSELNLAGREWTPIGTMAHPFMGTFNGAQKAIYFMTLTGDRYDYYGLFGVVKESLITKVDMRNSYINVGGKATGGIIGYAENTDISYSTNGAEDIEKLGFPTSELAETEMNSISSIESWFTQAQKRGTMEDATGGSSNFLSNEGTSAKTNSSAVSGKRSVGGIVGKIEHKTSGIISVESCWNTGSVTANASDTNCGGIIGWMRAEGKSSATAELEVYNCVSCAVISGTASAGGIVGYADIDNKGNASGDWIAACYAMGSCKVTESGNSAKCGALVGREYRASGSYLHIGKRKESGADTVCRSFWDSSMSGVSKALGASACNSNESFSKTKEDLTKTSSSDNGWGTGSWKEYDKEKSSTSGSEVTYRQLCISPSGASDWSVKSSSPYNYYSWTETLSTYTVTFSKNSGSGGTSSTSVVSGNNIGTITKPTRAGYTFAGYYTSTSGGTQYVNKDGNGTHAVTSNITLYAHWTANQYKVTLNKQSGSGGTDEVTATYGSSMPSASKPSRTNYTFGGYWTEQSGAGTQYYTSSMESANAWNIAENTTLYAYWIANTITITADANGGSLSGWSTSTKEINIGEQIGSLPSATRTGYTFDYWWTLASGGTRVYTTTTFTSSKTIYAHWTANTYTVTLDRDGGSGGSTSVTATYGSSMPSANKPTKNYYVFNGYYLYKNGSGTKYYTASMGSNATWNRTSSTTLYAYWTAEKITISYNSQGGSTVSNTTVSYGSVLTSTNLPTPTRSGYTFDGWYISTTSSTKLTTSTTANETSLSINGIAGSYKTTFYAKWTEKKPIITLSATDADGYSSTWENRTGWTTSTSAKTATRQYTNNVTFDSMPKPTRTGYTFEGWFSSTSSTATQYTGTDKVFFDGNTTLYAQWTAIEYNLTILPDKGTYSGATTVGGSVKGTVTLGAISRTGYTFVEWKVTSGVGSVAKNSSGNWIYTFGAGDGTVSAIWKNNTYTLTFNLNDTDASWGTIDTSIFKKSGNNYTKTVTFDETIKTMPNPTKAGYKFDGWYESSTSTEVWTPDKYYTVAGNKTLYAKFTANPYVLTIERGNEQGTYNESGKIGQTVTLSSTLTKTGYTFGGWEKVSGAGTLSGYTFTFGAGDAIVRAKWDNNKYTVNYHANGGTGSMSSSPFTYDVHGTLTANGFTRTGWQFVRWNTRADDSGTSYIDKADVYNWTATNGGVIDLYAQWGPITYNITFDANGGIIQAATGFSGSTGGRFSIATYNYEQTLSVLPDVKLTGYTFGGWYYDEDFTDAKQVKTSDKATQNCTVYAKLTANTYTLTLDGLDATLASASGWTISSDKHTATKSVIYDSAIGEMPEPTLAGHTFKGWFDGTGMDAVQYIASSLCDFDKAKTLYARYETDTMTIFFDAAGGSVDASQRVVVCDNSIGALPTPTRAGYEYKGWFYEGTTTQANANDKVTKTITLVAKWEAKSYTLTFDANGGNIIGSGSTYRKSVTYDEEIGNFPTVTKLGATLVGWFENANGSGTQYLPTSIVKFTQNTTIYAYFDVEKYTVIFNSNGGSCSVTSKNYEYNTAYGTLPTPSKVGYKFLGWTKETEGTNYVTASGKVTEAHTLHAQYKANTYYINFDKNRDDASGSAMAQITAEYGIGIKLTKNAFSTASAEFRGWNTKANGSGDAFSDEQIVYNLTSGDGATITLYAQWADNTYQVVIDTLNTVVGNQNGYTQFGSFALRKTFSHNAIIGGFPTLTKRGYQNPVFKDENGNVVTESTKVTSDMRLIPEWEAKTITYTFDANGGTFKDTGSGSRANGVIKIAGKFGDQIGKLPTVERVGYTFRYFVERGNESYTIFDGITITVEDDVYAVAQWDALSYVVVFNAGEGTIDTSDEFVGGTSSVTKYVAYDSTYGAMPTATLRGNAFKGWWTEPNMNGTKVESTTKFEQTSSVTLYAGWETSRYTVTISANGGNFGSNTDVTKKITGDYGKSYELPIPSRTGYSFNGYDHKTTDDGVASDSTGKWMFTFGLGDAQLSAKWTANTYTLTFDYVESGVTIVSGTKETERTITYDREFGAFPVPQVEGKTFAGWARENGTFVNGTDIVKDTADFTLFAQWTTDEYTLTINPNGGTYGGTTQNTTIQKKLGETTEVAAPTRTGYTFIGWTEAFVGKNGSTTYTGLSGTTYTFGEGNGSLTAKWEAITYTIKFVGGDGAVGEMADQVISYGATVALSKNKFTKAGYEFSHWLRADSNIEYGDTETVLNLVDTAGQTLTFTAQWKVKSYVLTIDPNGGIYNGSTAGTQITDVFGAQYKIVASNMPTRKGYKFIGFEDNANLTGSITGGYTYTFSDKNDTIISKWEVRVINVTLVIPDGAAWTDEATTKFGVGADKKGHIIATFGETYNLIPTEDDIEYAGYVFKGFFTESGAYIDSSSYVNFEEDITLTAKYTERLYTLTIDPNRGEYDNTSLSQTYDGQIGTEYPLLTPSRTGYTFSGWEQSGRGTLAADNSKFTFVDDNCKLTAIWTANTYKIVFDKNGENVTGTMADLPCEYDMGGRLPENAYQKQGYTFIGWALEKGGSINGYGDGAYFSNLTSENNGVVTLYAQWQVNTYTITFVPNGGMITSPFIERAYGAEYGEFPTATKEGYTHAGWFTELNGGTKVKSDDKVTGAITLYAHWTANKYTITFKAGSGYITAGNDGYTGATGKDIKETTIEVTFGEVYSGMPSADHDSKLFAGWFVSESADSMEIKSTTTVTVAGDQTFYAQWASDTYIVSFDANGGVVSVLSLTVSHGEAYGTLPVPTYTGYTFDGWFFENTDDEITETSEVTHKGNHTLRAHWTANTYKVTFDYDGGAYVETEGFSGDGSTKSVTYDEVYGVLPTAAKTGMRTLGWFDADGRRVDESKLVKILEDITLTAKYENETYSLVIELNGGKYNEFEQVQTFYGIYGQTIDLFVPTKTGYNFAGYENRTGVGAVEKDGDIYRFTFGADDSTLYANWDAKDIRVTFHTEYGELDGTNISISSDKKTGTREYKFGDKFNVVGKLPSVTFDGYRFLGWFTEKEGGFLMSDEKEITIPNNFDLYAQFEPVLYMLTLDPQGGIFNDSQYTYDFVDKQVGDKIQFNTPTREGYKFTRFIQKGVGTLTALDEQLTRYEFVFGAGNATITAQWEAEKYVVTFDYNGADGGDTTPTIEVTYDQIYGTLPVPTKMGYDFAGWFTEPEDGNRVNETTTVKTASAHTLYAHWELHKYKLQVLLSGGMIDNVAATDKEFEGYFGDTIEFNLPTRVGYNFNEFSRDGDKGTLVIRDGKVYFTFGDDNCKLTAVWENKEVIVNFDYDNATSGNETTQKTVKYDEQYGDLPTPSKVGYDFVGWFDSRISEKPMQIIPSVLVKNAETHTLYAVFKKITTSLTIVLDGGTLTLEENPINKEFGYQFTFGEPTKTGFTFAGYTSTISDALVNNGNGTWTYTFGTVNAVVTAHWTAQSVKVAFVLPNDAMAEGVSIDWTGLSPIDGNALNVTFGEKYGTLPKVSRYGWEFKGWFTEENGQGERIIDTSSVTNAEDHTLYAYFEQYTYTLKIDLNGGTADGQKLEISGHANETITIIKPIKTGYTFSHFEIVSGDITTFEDNELQFKFKESDARIFAQYTANEYIITFNANGEADSPATIPTSTTGEWSVGADSISATKPVTFGQKIGAMPTPTRSGYQFLGWSVGGVEGEDVYTPLTFVDFAKDLTLNAIWSSDKFSLTIDLDGGRLEGQEKSVIPVTGSANSTYDILTKPTKTGYTFSGFEVEYAVEGQGKFEDLGNNSWRFTFGTGSATILATWTPIDVIIRLDANGATFDESTLNGWTLNDAKTIATKTLKYKDLLGKIVNADGTTTIGALPQVSLDGSKFTGWIESGKLYSETSPIEWITTTTLTADFAKNNYLLVVNTNGGTYTDDEYKDKVGVFNISKEYGSSYTLKAPSKVGYKFTGWTGSGVGDFNTETYKFIFGAGTYTITANYDPIKYTIVFDANGGSGTMEKQEFTYDESAVLTDNAFTRAGFTFKEWNTADDGTGKVFKNMGMILNETTTDGSEITLYAIWDSAWITMYFDANNGTADPVGIDVQYGKPFGALPSISRKGYDFGGWYESIVNDIPQGTPIETTTICEYTESRTFVAYWTIASYEITLPSGYSNDAMKFNVLAAYQSTLNEDKSKATIVYNHDFAFEIEILEAYSQSKIKVYAVNKITQVKKEILPINGAYMLTQIDADIIISVENLNKNTYTILFDACEGAFGDSRYTTVTVEWGEKITKPTRPTRLHYDFTGWFEDRNSQYEFDFTEFEVYENLTLYAKYDKAYYDINFYVDDALYRTDRVQYEGIVTKPSDPTKDGYNFIGWRLKDGTMYVFTSQVMGEVDLYAAFSKNTYTVRFYNGARLLDSVEVEFGERVKVNFGTGITGYDLDGWYADAKFETLFDFDTPITGDTNIYGKYVLQQFTVSFYVNGELQKSQRVGYNRFAVSPKDGDITIEVGYHIANWYTDVDLTRPYDFNTPITSDLVLFGEIEKDTIVITFVANGQRILRYVKYGETLTDIPAVPARVGYDQVAPYWENADLTNITSPITVNAVYTINKYTVKIVMPNGEEIYREVEYGQTLTDLPEISTKFGDKIVYDNDLTNIMSNLVVHVKVQNYIFWPLIIAGGILALLVLIFIIFLIVKASQKRNSRDKIKELIDTRGR